MRTILGKRRIQEFFACHEPDGIDICQVTAVVRVADYDAISVSVASEFYGKLPKDIAILCEDGWNGSFHDPHFWDEIRGVYVVRLGKRGGGLKRVRRTARQFRERYAELATRRSEKVRHRIFSHKFRVRIMLIRRGIWREEGD